MSVMEETKPLTIVVPPRFEQSLIAGEKTRDMVNNPQFSQFQRGQIVILRAGGSDIEVRVTGTFVAVIDETSMTLNGRPLYGTLHSRDQFEPTDNEFAEQMGFPGGFMDMRWWIDKAYDLSWSKGNRVVQMHGFTFEVL